MTQTTSDSFEPTCMGRVLLRSARYVADTVKVNVNDLAQGDSTLTPLFTSFRGLRMWEKPESGDVAPMWPLWSAHPGDLLNGARARALSGVHISLSRVHCLSADRHLRSTRP